MSMLCNLNSASELEFGILFNCLFFSQTAAKSQETFSYNLARIVIKAVVSPWTTRLLGQAKPMHLDTVRCNYSVCGFKILNVCNQWLNSVQR